MHVEVGDHELDDARHRGLRGLVDPVAERSHLALGAARGRVQVFEIWLERGQLARRRRLRRVLGEAGSARPGLLDRHCVHAAARGIV